MEKENILELRNITKTFGDFAAVDNVDFALQAGEIHAILGENGAGKSTLMNLIYGLYQPSEPDVSMLRIVKAGDVGYGQKSPRDAIAIGIGMVHQHFMLVENLTVAENIALSLGQSQSARTGGRRVWKQRIAPKLSKFPSFQVFGKLDAFRFKKGRRDSH